MFACILPDRRGAWTRSEITFLCWTRETGVVPAALVGVLAGLGVPDIELYAAVVALAVIVTLFLQALPAGWLAGRLGLLEERAPPAAEPLPETSGLTRKSAVTTAPELPSNPKLWLVGKAFTVGAQVAAEKVRSPKASTADDVPTSGEAMTNEWLTAVLCREVPGASVVGFSTPGGSSGSSERLALRVTYNDAGREAGLPTELYTKASSLVQAANGARRRRRARG